MKMKMLTLVGLASLFLFANAEAQVQNYYHFNGVGLNDHGTGNEIIQTSSPTVPVGMVVAGAAFTTANVPSAFIAKYDNAGVAVFHRFFRLNAAPAGNICEAVGVVEATTTAVHGFGLLCYTNAAPAQTVLIKTDVNGNFIWKTEIGALRGASVAYDAANQRFLCLTQVFTQGTNQMQLVVVNANTGAILFNRYVDGCQGDDTPVTVIHDTGLNNYVCLGTSRNLSNNDIQILVARITTAGAVVYIRTFGDPGRSEIATDLLRNPAAAEFTIGGYIPGTPNVPFFAKLTVAGAAANIFPCNLPGDNISKRMAFINGQYMMVGRQTDATGNVNAFLVSVNTAYAPLNYRVYGQPPIAGAEELNDISLGSVAALPTLMCGRHQRTVAWLGSPAGTAYNWVVTANNLGIGTCPPNAVYTNTTYAPAVNPCMFNETAMVTALTTQANITQAVTALNECTNPNRLAGVVKSTSETLLYPNPANTELIAEIELSENETAELLILDLTGRIVRKDALGNQSGRVIQDVSSLPEGMYICIIQTAERTLLEQKIIIAH